MQRLDHFMGDALSRYYDSRDPLGKNGDFTTALKYHSYSGR